MATSSILLMIFGLGTGSFIPAWCVAFTALWCLVAKTLALLGWQRLARDYRVVAPPVGPQLRLDQLKVGPVSYGGIVTATLADEGLALRTSLLFRVGHPPLLIPWQALEPFVERRFLWLITYRTTVLARSGARVHLQLADKRVVELISLGRPAG
jgi:hypothetical protein